MKEDEAVRATHLATQLAQWAVEQPGVLGEEFDRRLGTAADELDRPVVLTDGTPDLYVTLAGELFSNDLDAIVALGETLVAQSHARYRDRHDQRCFWAYNLTLGAISDARHVDDEAFAVRFLTETIRWSETVDAVWGLLDMYTDVGPRALAVFAEPAIRAKVEAAIEIGSW